MGLELRRQIFDALASAPDVDFAVTDAATNITLGPPTDIGDASVVASLYLYHIDVDKHLRNQDWLPVAAQPDARRLPPLPLQLRYFLTPVDAEETNNHLLVGRVIQHFHDNPRFSALIDTPLGDSFGGASTELRVHPDFLSMEQLAQIWSAFSAPYRLSVAFLVEIVAVDSGKPPVRVPRVTENVFGAGTLVAEGTP